MGCQRRGENFTGIGIKHDVQLSPRAALRWTGAGNIAAMDTQELCCDVTLVTEESRHGMIKFIAQCRSAFRSCEAFSSDNASIRHGQAAPRFV